MKFVNNTLLTRMSNSTDSQSRELRSISLNMNADQVEDILLVHCVTLWQHVVSQYVDTKMILSTLLKQEQCYYMFIDLPVTFHCVKTEVQGERL